MEVDKLQSIVENLFSLKVSTIVKPNMTATTMPNMATALCDIATEYGAKLRALTSKVPAKSLNGEASLAVFEELERMTAEHIHAHAASSKDTHEEEGLFMLARIRDNARQLQAIFRGKEPELTFDRTKAEEMSDDQMKLTDKQKVLIRKTWELGTEEVAMQTVIYLDGDVITRLQPRYYLEQDKQALIQIHNRSVETSITFWGNLVRLAETFVAAFFGGKV
jgi:hypothetical protein